LVVVVGNHLSIGKQITNTNLEQSKDNYVELFFYRVPKKNYDAVTKNLKQFIPLFEKHGVGIEYYRLDNGVATGFCENIAKPLSASEDEDIWMVIQHFRDCKHSEDVYAAMKEDKSLEEDEAEFLSLITQGSSLVNGGFDRLR
jgi:uncharacterized protein YbaA (DUF1428 family)